jgi:hypothetical protein
MRVIVEEADARHPVESDCVEVDWRKRWTADSRVCDVEDRLARVSDLGDQLTARERCRLSDRRTLEAAAYSDSQHGGRHSNPGSC